MVLNTENNKIKNMFIFVLFFFLYLVAAYYLVYHLQFVFSDAVSRAEKAFLVIYDNEPKLAAIGFIWNPLPSLLQIPLLFVLKPLAKFGFSGNIISALFGALSCVYVYKFFDRTSLSRSLKWFFMLLFGLNPMILFYATNGMSESMFIFFLMLATWHFVMWQESQKMNDIIMFSLAISLAFLTRYEAIPFAITIGLLIILFDFYKHKNFRNVEGNLILYAAPVISALLIWVVANWLIMGDPLYFLHGQYSNVDQSQFISGDAKGVQGLFWGVISYAIKRMWFIFPAYLITVVFVLYRKFSFETVAVVLLSITIPIFQCIMIFTGSSYGWLRFFIYVIPFAFILFSQYLHNEKRSQFMIAVFLVMFLLSDISSFGAMKNKTYGKEEIQVINAMRGDVSSNNSYITDVEIANYINENLGDKKILMDDFIGFGIILNSLNPKIFINDSDADFAASIADPKRYCDYILVKKPNDLGTLDAINKKYPTLFDSGSNFAHLSKDFGTWRLYEVN